MSRRPSANETLCASFRSLLTDGFYSVDENGEIDTPDERANALSLTKPWRAEVWRAFRDLEDRLCPVKKFERTGLP